MMKSPHLNPVVYGACFVVFSSALSAKGVEPKLYDGSISFYSDNDRASGNDSDYTNGFRFSWVSRSLAEDELNFMDRGLGYLAGLGASSSWLGRLKRYENGSDLVKQRSVGFTHLMYTPKDNRATSAPPGEHPYAGWMGLGYGLSLSGENTVSSAELVLGVVGPAAHAHEMQDAFHSINDVARFEGWDSQIPNEVTLNLYLDTKRRIPWAEMGKRSGFASDAHWSTGVALGNFKTQAKLGGMMRVGWHLPDEVRDMRLSESAHAQAGFQGVGSGHSNWSGYLFAGSEVRGILHEAVLDGPLLRNFETGVKKEPVVLDVYLGAAFRYKRLDVGVMHTFQSDRYTTQQDEGDFSSFFVSIKY